MILLRRSISSVLLVTLLPLLSGCTTTATQQLSPAEVRTDEVIVGVTTKSGEQISFDVKRRAGKISKKPRSAVRNDTLFVTYEDGEAEAYAIEDLAAVWIERSKTNVAATIGAVALGALVVFGIIALIATSADTPPPGDSQESCPFVYSWDGTRFVFDAEPYGGAITRGLERDDFSELESLRIDDGVYRVRLVNELDETQHTNFVALQVVDHPVGTTVAVDLSGAAYALGDPIPPISATDAHGNDLRVWLEATDRAIWEAPPALEPEADPRQDIILTFPKPMDATRVKLVANVTTGWWGSHILRESLALRGNALDDFYATLDSNPEAVADLYAWNHREELFELRILVEETTGWEERGVLLGSGPFTSETRVVPLDISRAQGDELRVRIRPPRGFWALNSFAVDYGSHGDVRVTQVPPRSARDANGSSVLGELGAIDDRYHTMPETGDWAEVLFQAPPEVDGMRRTVFMHSRGYYRIHIESEGPPNTVEIQRIMEEPDGAARFAARRLAEAMEVAAGD